MATNYDIPPTEFYALGTSAIAARQDHQPVGTPGLDIDDDEED